MGLTLDVDTDHEPYGFSEYSALIGEHYDEFPSGKRVSLIDDMGSVLNILAKKMLSRGMVSIGGEHLVQKGGSMPPNLLLLPASSETELYSVVSAILLDACIFPTDVLVDLDLVRLAKANPKGFSGIGLLRIAAENLDSGVLNGFDEVGSRIIICSANPDSVSPEDKEYLGSLGGDVIVSKTAPGGKDFGAIVKFLHTQS